MNSHDCLLDTTVGHSTIRWYRMSCIVKLFEIITKIDEFLVYNCFLLIKFICVGFLLLLKLRLPIAHTAVFTYTILVFIIVSNAAYSVDKMFAPGVSVEVSKKKNPTYSSFAFITIFLYFTELSTLYVTDLNSYESQLIEKKTKCHDLKNPPRNNKHDSFFSYCIPNWFSPPSSVAYIYTLNNTSIFKF